MKRQYFLTLFCLIFSAHVCFSQGRYEAEDGTLTGSVSVKKSLAGYSGTGYVGNFETDGDKVTVTFNLTNGGYFNLFIGYAGTYGQKINKVTINGNSVEVTFPASSGFKEASAGKIKLNSGNNTLSVTKNWGWFLVDYFRIEPNTDPVTQFNISPDLVTPGATDETNRLFRYLIYNFEKNIHSGVMSLNAKEEAEWLYTKTGKYPALIGLDFMNHNRNYNWYDKSVLVKETVNWYRKNGMVTLMWHWRDPLQTTEEFYTNKTSFDVSKVTDETSAEYIAMVNDIDIIAGYLKQIQDSGVPVLFRPLHEASGKWFWWGAKGAEPVKTLWRLMFDRLVNHHGIKNLIWIWTTDVASDNRDWYPGDEYVDILGMDIYVSAGDYSSQLLNFEKVKEDFQGKKLVTLSENGLVPDPDNLVNDGAGWSWFMTWYGNFVRVDNPVSHWQKIMDHPYVITLDEMPDLKNFSGAEPEKTQEDFRFSYNRVGKSIYISSVYTKLYDLSVIDLSGKVCFAKKGVFENTSLSLAKMNPGVYFVKITSEDFHKTYKILHIN